MTAGLIVPVMANFKGFAKLMRSVDIPVLPIVIDNWTENIGVSKAWNLGLGIASDHGCSYAFVVNDDVIFEPGAMRKMIDGIDAGYDLVSAFGGDSDAQGVHEVVDQDSPDFAAYVVKPKDFIEKFGLFDEHFTPAYFEDNDMRYRVKVAGGKQGVVLNAKMHHEGSVTQHWEGGQVVTSPMFEKNREYYRTKWGGTPGEERFLLPFHGMLGHTHKDWQ